jgi:hypothetical protein
MLAGMVVHSEAPRVALFDPRRRRFLPGPLFLGALGPITVFAASSNGSVVAAHRGSATLSVIE